MKFGSLFAGIGGFDLGLERAGMKCAWQVEIDKNARTVLQRHWPNVQKYEDVRDVGSRNLESVNLICGGFPCQDLSVAGKRAGLDGKRSGLWFEFHRILSELRPSWVVVENVPGLLSSNDGKDFAVILDALEDLRYVVDCDILDAQYFGVPQRRRRVFIVCQHIDDILKKKTTSSAQTIAQCLIEILGSVLIEAERRSPLGRNDLDFANSKDGLLRRIKLFGIAQADHLLKLRDNLDAELARFHRDGQRSVMDLLGAPGEDISRITRGDQSSDTKDETVILNELWNTDSTWNSTLAELYHLTKSFTTSTESKPIAESRIFSCAKAVLGIVKFISLSSNSCPIYWNAASSALTVLEEYITYARQANSSLFTELEWFYTWGDFIGQAEKVRDALCDTGIECAAQVLFERESGVWNPPPSRETGEGVTGGVATGINFSGLRGRQPGSAATMIAFGGNNTSGSIDVSTACNAHGSRRYDFESETFIAFDKSRGTVSGNIAAPLRVNGGASPGVNDGKADNQCVAFASHIQGTPRTRIVRTGDYAQVVGANPDAIMYSKGVRRLTPTECCRLQGFPDNWNAGQSDTQRYKQLGNAVTVPVIEWIGERIVKTSADSADVVIVD